MEELSLHVVDWFWRQAVIADLNDSSVLVFNTHSGTIGGHCASWLQIPQVFLVYMGEEAMPVVTSAAELAIKDVCPRELTVFALAQTRLAFQYGKPVWMATKTVG